MTPANLSTEQWEAGYQAAIADVLLIVQAHGGNGPIRGNLAAPAVRAIYADIAALKITRGLPQADAA